MLASNDCVPCDAGDKWLEQPHEIGKKDPKDPKDPNDPNDLKDPKDPKDPRMSHQHLWIFLVPRCCHHWSTSVIQAWTFSSWLMPALAG